MSKVENYRDSLICDISEFTKMMWGFRPRYNYGSLTLRELYQLHRDTMESYDIWYEVERDSDFDASEADLWGSTYEEEIEMEELQSDFWGEIENSLEKGLKIPAYRL